MPDALRLLLVTDVFPPRCGGSGWSTYHLARALRQRGHTVVVARPQGAIPSGTKRVSEFDGFAVHELGPPRARFPFIRGLAMQEFFWPRFATFISELAAAEGTEVIHGQHLLSVPAAVRAGAPLGLPVVATVRDYWPTCPTGTRLPHCDNLPRCSAGCRVCCVARGKGYLRPAVWSLRWYIASNLRRRQEALRAARRVVAVSEHVAGVLRAEVPGIAPLVLPNFVDLEEFDRQTAPDATRQERTVLYVGKLERHKGADLLPSALAAVPGARLIVAGEGSLRAAVERDCTRLGVHVEMRGEVSNEIVGQLLRAASLLIFPARWEEPLSRTLLEAGAAGLPVVALATGGTPEIVLHDETGLLVERPEELATALAELLQDRDRLRSFGARARGHISAHFSRDAVAPRFEALYREAFALGHQAAQLPR